MVEQKPERDQPDPGYGRAHDQARREQLPANTEALGHRLQEDRKGKHIDRAGANQEAADRREDDPPAIPKKFRQP